MRKILCWIILILLLFGMITPFALADNETNQTNVTVINSTTVIEGATETFSNIISHDWMVSGIHGGMVINFENKAILQKEQLQFISGKNMIINVDCVPHNENNDLCDYLIYQQNVNLKQTYDILQRWDVSIMLPDSDEYASKLIFTDDNDITYKIIVKAHPRSEFDFDGSTNIMGFVFNTAELSILIAIVILVLLFFAIETTTWRIILLVVLGFPLSFVIYLLLSFL